MRSYLSMGGGVNSVAMMLMLLDQGVEFEAVFVDHGADWPETYEYVEMLREAYPITVLKPAVHIKTPYDADINNLYEYCYAKQYFPNRVVRWCTDKFKRQPLQKYHKTPCFVMIGYGWEERHRAKIFTENGQEFRFPLIESEIDRDGCKEIIKRHGLPIPRKSGCYICPFQRVGQLRELRKKHPDLFCKLEQLENRNNQYRAVYGSSDIWPWVADPYYSFGKPVREVAEKNIDQLSLFEQDEYPPCQCGL